jgi:hypothetical protein
LIGAGVAKIELVDGIPTVTERYGDSGWWWDATTNPTYGDKAAFRDPNSDYIYAWGGPPASATDFVSSQYVYQIRVNATDAFDKSSYEYWWGRDQGWSTDPLNTFDNTTAVMWNVGQGQVVWSEHFGTYIFVGLGECTPICTHGLKHHPPLASLEKRGTEAYTGTPRNRTGNWQCQTSYSSFSRGPLDCRRHCLHCDSF